LFFGHIFLNNHELPEEVVIVAIVLILLIQQRFLNGVALTVVCSIDRVHLSKTK